MAAPSNPTSTPAKGGGSLIPPEWSDQAADMVVDTISKVRDKTTRPAQVAARAVVYGLIIAVVATIATVLALVLIFRMYDNWVPGSIWIAYAACSVLCIFGGLRFLRKANRASFR